MARHIRQQPVRETIALVGDGHTERYYFSDIIDNDRPRNFHIKPDYPRRIGSFQGALARAIELTTSYTHVFALIDMDKILDEKKMPAYRIAKEQAIQTGVTVLENNPCFEIWILLHFVTTGKPFTKCQDVVSEIKKMQGLADYDKSEKYFRSAKLYSRFKSKIISAAIPNSRILEKDRDDKTERYPRAELFKFFEWYFNRAKT